MSGQFIPWLNGLPPLPLHPPPRPAGTAPEAAPPSHGRGGPDSPWCVCGRPREACVSDVVRHLWRGYDHVPGHPGR
jgi:hypothetical protein